MFGRLLEGRIFRGEIFGLGFMGTPAFMGDDRGACAEEVILERYDA
ncbi:hypothetical protein [Bartonella sp. TT67HLJMS]